MRDVAEPEPIAGDDAAQGGAWDEALRLAYGPDASPPGPVRNAVLGDFRLVREIGRGGMGVVYEAEQISLERTVALKVLRPHVLLDPVSVERFLREARATARFQHAGIVTIHTVGTHNGTHYYAMEFLPAAPLSDVLDATRESGVESASGALLKQAVESLSRRPLDVRPGRSAGAREIEWGESHVAAVVDIAAQVANALHHAHEAGVVHRDVKPANILLRQDGTAVLIDFGLARPFDQPALTPPGCFAGTPYYASPEQARASTSEVDRRSDVYSLGATLYELLTFRRPFRGESRQQVLCRILETEPPELRRLNPNVDLGLQAVVRRAMEREPCRRYATADALAGALRAQFRERPVPAAA